MGCLFVCRNGGTYTAKIVNGETAEKDAAQYDAMLEEISKTDVEKLNAAYTEKYQANLAAQAE